MNPRTRAALASGLVFPGLGQVLNQQAAKGYALIASELLLVLWLAVRIFRLTWKSLAIVGPDGLQGVRMDPGAIAQVHNQAWALNWWLAALIIALWIYSIIDAYHQGGKGAVVK